MSKNTIWFQATDQFNEVRFEKKARAKGSVYGDPYGFWGIRAEPMRREPNSFAPSNRKEGFSVAAKNRTAEF